MEALVVSGAITTTTHPAPVYLAQPLSQHSVVAVLAAAFLGAVILSPQDLGRTTISRQVLLEHL